MSIDRSYNRTVRTEYNLNAVLYPTTGSNSFQYTAGVTVSASATIPKTIFSCSLDANITYSYTFTYNWGPASQAGYVCWPYKDAKYLCHEHTIVIPYRSNRWNLPGRMRVFSEIDLAPEAAVLSFSVNKGLLSGTINVLTSPNEAQGNGTLEEVKLRYVGRWYPVYIGTAAFDIRHDTGDRSLLLSESAIIKYSRFEEPYEMRLVNVSKERVSVLGIQAPGVTYLGDPVVVEPGSTVTLAVKIDANYDMVRPWILCSTSTGEHMIPGASCYRIPAHQR